MPTNGHSNFFSEALLDALSLSCSYIFSASVERTFSYWFSVHRDLKPQNVLLWLSECSWRGFPACSVVGLGLSKKLPADWQMADAQALSKGADPQSPVERSITAAAINAHKTSNVSATAAPASHISRAGETTAAYSWFCNEGP